MGDSSIDDLLGGADDDSDTRGHRGRRRKGDGIRGLVPMLLVLCVLLGVGVVGYMGVSWVTSNVSVEEEPQDFEGEGSGEVTIQVKAGDTGSDIAASLVEAGVIKSQGPFVQAFAANPDASSITPGTYKLRKQMNSSAALKLLMDPQSNVGIRVTIPEGITAEKIYGRLSEASGIDVAEFEKAAENYKALGVPENPAKSVEGYLWPGTYDIQEDQDATAILTMMVDQMRSQLESKKVPEDKWHETLTLASIAEKEARTDDDFGKVIRTIDNRLTGVGEAKGSPMPLQLDSTVAYFNGIDTVSTTPQQRAKESPYNTYLHPGLPVGPISNPGAATINAALNPPDGPWLYWVTVNTETGETKFAKTKAEHDRNVQEWREWARNR